jgi:hypothetical protein
LTRPTRWLFPGRDSEWPLDATVLHAACRSAHIAATGLRQARPEKIAAVDALGEQAQPRAISEQDLYQRRILAAEDEQMAGERILLQVLLIKVASPSGPLRMSV